MQRSLDGSSLGPEATSELDLRALGAVLKQRRRTIIIPTALAFAVVGLFVSVATPRYTAESQVLLENQYAVLLPMVKVLSHNVVRVLELSKDDE